MAHATSVVPITDQELYRRADVVVRGVVASSDATVDDHERPEMLTVIEPLAVLKGSLSGSLVLHQVGADLPDGRFLKMWGRPDYEPGSEVIVFAIRRPAGEYETAEMLLGKFRILEDGAGVRFAIPELAAETRSNDVEIFDSLEDAAAARRSSRPAAGQPRRFESSPDSLDGPRDLERLLAALARGSVSRDVLGSPRGALRAIRHPSDRGGRREPQWGNISNFLYRWNNNATAGWSFNGTANITGGGTAEATSSLATWTTDPNSNINYTTGSGNVIYLNATTSALGCGWSSCLSGGGVIGCGGPSGGGSNSWRGDSYYTILGGTVELRSYCTLNGFDSITTQAVLTHELGHTLGLGHSDVNVSPHDVCRGDEAAAQMRSSVQHRTTLGTDDQDSIRWIYGDGGNWCTFTLSAVTPAFGPTAGGTLMSVVGTGFQAGATVTIGGVNASVGSVSASTILATSPPGTAGSKDVVVTNPDLTSRTLAGGFTYGSASFYTLSPCRVIDTRNPAGPFGGPALGSGSTRSFTVTGQCGIPAGAKAISANVTATQPAAAGDLRIYPAGGILPLTSVLNYSSGQTRANNAVLELGATGGITVRCDLTTVQFVLDVTGYFD